MRSLFRGLRPALLGALTLFYSVAAGAADIKWSGTTGDYNSPANWEGVVPGAGDNAIVNNAGTVNITSDVSANDLRAGDGSATATGTYNQTAGTANVTSWVRIGSQGGGTTSGTGVYNLSGGTLKTGGPVLIGELGGTGTFNQTGGAITVGGGNWFSIAQGMNGTGSYNMSAGTLAVGGDFNVTDNPGSTGTLNLSGTGAITAPNVFIGKSAGAEATVVQTGGSLTAGAGGIKMATDPTSTASYTLSGGTLDGGGRPLVAGAGTFTFNFTGGTLQNVSNVNFPLLQNGGTLHPSSPNGFSTIQISNGGYTQSDNSALLMDLKSDGTVGDKLISAGNVKLGGSLSLHIAGPGQVPVGTTFTLVEPGIGSVTTGAFSNAATATADNGQQFKLTYNGGPGGSNVIATAAFIPPPDPGARPVYRALEPRTGDAKGLVLAVHGWNSDPSAWANSVVSDIKSDLGSRASQWDIRSYDWHEWSTFLGGPLLASANGVMIGNRLGAQIRAMGYSEVHLIGHSAGAWLINAITAQLTGSGIKTQETFLDAYVPQLSNGSKVLGGDATFAEQYVDSRPLPPLTNTTLVNAYNVDVTALDPNHTWDVLHLGAHPHAWPYQWYEMTTHAPTDPIGQGYGFALSPESNPSGTLASFSDYPRGGRINLSASRAAATAPPAMGNTLDLTALPHITSDTGTITTVNSTTVRLTSGSPAWIVSQASISQVTNLVDFTYDFTSNADGWLSVFFNGNLVYNAEEDAFQGRQSESVWLPNDALPGTYQLSFRLDPSNGIQSIVDISDVRFGYQSSHLAGDANSDGVVDFKDLLVLAQHYGLTGGVADGDFTADGVVGFSDLLLIAQNYGLAVPGGDGGAQLAPEPAMAAMLLIAATATYRRRRFRVLS